MKVANESEQFSPVNNFDLNVCDTEYCSRGARFSAFRDAIASAFMPWRLDINSEAEFDGRMLSMNSSLGTVARVKMSPVTAFRGNLEVSRSSLECYYANYVLSGELCIEQSGRSVTAKRGDMIVYDSSLPVKLIEKSRGFYEDLALRIPKVRLAEVRNADSLLGNVVISADRMIAPLSSSLAYLTENLLIASTEELAALYEICALLLPVAAGHLAEGNERWKVLESESTNRYLRELMHFITENVGNAGLSPSMAADHLGISVRYVHKQFAARGTTFGTYVMAKRLELVRRDLISESCRHQPIFSLAFRWGFNDLSTFIRAFKKKFGCSPSQYRLKF